MLWVKMVDESQPAPRGLYDELALCPACKSVVIPRCGEVNIWHWAHEAGSICDRFSEPETQWHLEWKEHIDENRCEVVITKAKSVHIADIMTTDGTVVELQHSPISSDMIQDREHFYGRMIWLFDADKFIDNLEFRDRDEYISFRWKHPWKSHWACGMPVFWHLGDTSIYLETEDSNQVPIYNESILAEDDYVFQVRKIYHHVPCGGWGVFWTRAEFMKRFLV